MDIVALVITAAPSIISGVVLGKVHGWQKTSDENTKLRQREGYLMMKVLDANGELAKQTARCIQGQKPNGELTSALERQEEVQRELEDHLMKIGSKLKG